MVAYGETGDGPQFPAGEIGKRGLSPIYPLLYETPVRQRVLTLSLIKPRLVDYIVVENRASASVCRGN